MTILEFGVLTLVVSIAFGLGLGFTLFCIFLAIELAGGLVRFAAGIARKAVE